MTGADSPSRDAVRRGAVAAAPPSCSAWRGGAAAAAAASARPRRRHSRSISARAAGVTERAIQLIALITVLSLAPSILVMVTSFTRIVVVLSLLRTALGTATAPPNAVIVASRCS